MPMSRFGGYNICQARPPELDPPARAPGRVWLFVGVVATRVRRHLDDTTCRRLRSCLRRVPAASRCLGGQLADRLLPRRDVRGAPAVPQAGAHALADRDRARVSACSSPRRRALLVAQLAGAAARTDRAPAPAVPVKLAFNLAELSLCTGIALCDLPWRSRHGRRGRACTSWLAALVAAAGAHAIGSPAGLPRSSRWPRERLAAPQLPRTFVDLARRGCRDGVHRAGRESN